MKVRCTIVVVVTDSVLVRDVEFALRITTIPSQEHLLYQSTQSALAEICCSTQISPNGRRRPRFDVEFATAVAAHGEQGQCSSKEVQPIFQEHTLTPTC